MKKALLAVALFASLSAHASAFIPANMECTNDNGNIIELHATKSFPRLVYIQGEKMPLRSASNGFGGYDKFYIYSRTENSEGFQIATYKNGAVGIFAGGADFYKCKPQEAKPVNLDELLASN